MARVEGFLALVQRIATRKLKETQDRSAAHKRARMLVAR